MINKELSKISSSIFSEMRRVNTSQRVMVMISF